MGLLQWCQLHPQGPSEDVAAVLFPAPVRVSSIRVFPTGAQPFSQSPTTIAETEPEAFFLNVFFNASPIQTAGSQDTQDRRAAKNVLAPTRIAYAGGQTEFSVDMGPEYATRLIIFQGEFQVISMAIYGDVIGEYPETNDYEPKPLPVPTSVPLSRSLDLGHSANPTSLVEQILSLLPSPAPLPLVIRLMFCLKPENEDWDHPDFPYVYSELDKTANEDDMETEVFDLESLVKTASKPLRDDVSAESLSEFAARMRDFLISNSSDDAYYVAKLLTKSACQQTVFSRILLQHLNLSETFNEDALDEATILCLLEAAANIEIARYFFEDKYFLQSLENMQCSPKTEKPIQKALKRLLARIYGWRTFEDALTNQNGDFATSAAFLKDISTEEYALGCWLECMINHDNLVDKLGENPVVAGSQYLPPLLFQERPPEVSHEEFIVFVRAFLGITPLLAALAWADSIGKEMCTERALSILVVWQGANGYREIVNHCLLLRQMTRRLQWIKNDEDHQQPKKSGILAERLLVGLAKDPHAMLRDDLVTTILSLKPPFCFIEADEILEMGKLAKVARDGLLAAIDELAYNSVRPISLRRLRVLRVSIAVIVEELSYDDGEWHVLESFWNEHHEGLIPRLVAILVDISDDLNRHFTLKPIPSMHQALCDLLFRTADDFLHLMTRFASTYLLTTRDLRTLTMAVADLSACSAAAIRTFSETALAYLAAQNIEQTCSHVLSRLSGPDVHAEPEASSAQIVLCTLLEHASQSAGRDPVHHVLQTYVLIDSILPREAEPTNAYWATSVFPKILSELKTFSRMLDPEMQALFIERLVGLDNGEIGLGEWLLTEEFQHLSATFDSLSYSTQDEESQLILRYQLSTGLRLLQLLLSSLTISSWTLSSLSSNVDLSQLLDSCLSHILEASISSLSLTHLIRELAKHASQFSPDVRFNILLLTLRNAQADPSLPDALDFVPVILKSLPLNAIIAEPLRNEVGPVLAAYSDHASIIKADSAEMLLQILEWLASREDIKLATLAGISMEAFQYLCMALAAALPSTRQEAISSVKTKLSIDEDELLPPSTTELPETLTLPLQAIENLLSPKPFEPSTPKGNKTPDILGVVISPPTALLRSPAATGLTKTYANNDFRQLRQIPSTRLNTSRLPSTHVDEFAHPPSELLPAIDSLAFQGLLGNL